MRAFGTKTEATEQDASAPTEPGRPGARRAPDAPDLEPRESLTSLLLASARHELRSPLQSIQGFAELLDCQAYGALTSEQQAFVTHILQGSEELGAMIEACLELAELEAGARPLAFAREDLQPLLSEGLAKGAARCGCEVRLHVRPGLPAVRAKVDAEALLRAVEALVMGVATGREELTAELDVEGEYACLRVSRVAGAVGGSLRGVDELARLRRAGRGLAWLRLSALLVAQHEGLLTATDEAERAEVRLRLSSTH